MIARRRFIQSASAAAIASAIGVTDAQQVPNSSGSEPAKLKAPAGACDCHHHIYDAARFPPPQSGRSIIPNARLEEFLILRKRIGITRDIVVTPAAYVTDNRVTLDAIARIGPDARGVAVIRTDISDAELKTLADGGIRGIRFSLGDPANKATNIDMIEPLSKRVNALGWHVQINMTADQIVAAKDLWNRLPSPIVFDHMGHVPQPVGLSHPVFGIIRRLVDKGHTWVKLSVTNDNTVDGPPGYADITRVAQTYIKAAPERMVWGSNWPHPNENNKPDDAVLFDLMSKWAPDEATRNRILVQNPAALYGFPKIIPMNPRLMVFIISIASLAPLASQVAKNTSAKTWAPPRTPDGQPDLQGTWTNPTITPFERPPELAAKPVLNKEEAAELEKKAAENTADRPSAPGDVGTYNQAWFDSGTKVVSTGQASLIVDPPDGRVPVKPWAEAKREYDLAHTGDSYEYMGPWDRCITRGVPGGMFPAGYNNAYRIVQSPGYVTILYEMIHETRIIPVDGSPHLPPTVRQWNGDSRGHWEGNTLVVDITNYNGKGWISTSAADGRIKGIPQSDALHVVERFTRTDPDTILYEARIDDPNVYTKPWTVSIPLTRDPNYQIYEYACHEGNEAMGDILRGGRAHDQGK